MSAWQQMLADFDAGKQVEMDEETYNYFLEVLPPVYMFRTVTVGGKLRRAHFGMAEGVEPIKAFWTAGEGEAKRYFGQVTSEVYRG